MQFARLVRRGISALLAIGALSAGGPGTALAACGPTSDSAVRYGAVGINTCDSNQLATIGQAENQVVIVDDQGFHPREVTVGQGGATNAQITFVNLGTNVHTATELPSSPMWNSGITVTMAQNGRGSTENKKKFTGRANWFDSGGITPDPGATVAQAMANFSFVVAGFGGTNGDYLYSSYPDCIAADRPTPSPTGFDCTPAIVHVVDNQESTKSVQKTLGPGAMWLGDSIMGTSLRPAGDPECAMVSPNNPLLAPGRNNEVCVASNRRSFAKAPAGSKSKPLTGNVTITIDDVYGFDPDNMAVAAGSTITFLNKPSNVLIHDVVLSKKPFDQGTGYSTTGQNSSAGGVNSGGLAPGQSWSFTPQFVTGGTIKFNPDTDVDTLYRINPQGNVGGKEAFIGKMAVVCPPGTFTTLSFDQARGLGQPCTAIAPAQDPSVLNAGPIKDY